MGPKLIRVGSKAWSFRTDLASGPTRSGFTLLELLVSLGLIAVLVAMLLPAIQYARESVRRVQCQSQVRQVGLAVHSYHASFNVFPSGWSQTASEAEGGFSLFVAILPQLEQTPLWHHIDFSDLFGEANAEIRATQIGLLLCPSDSGWTRVGGVQPTNYVGNAGSGVQYNGHFNGFFQPADSVPPWGGGMLKATDFTDGLSNTAMLSEVLIGNGSTEVLRNVWEVSPELSLPSQMVEFADRCEQVDISEISGDKWSRGGAWMYGDIGPTLYNHVQTPGRRSCTNAANVLTGAYPPVSYHSGGVNVCMGDGSVRFVSELINRKLWWAIGSRSDGDVVSSF